MIMRKLSLVSLLVLCWMVALPAMDADALGLGGYINFSSGTSTWTADDGNSEWDIDSDRKITDLGFVLDTAVARDTLFNYRLQLGYENWEDDNAAGEKLDLTGFVMTHDFGFGVLRTPNVRLWLGPEVKLAFVTGSPDGSPDFDVSLFDFGIGPVIGANFNIGSTVTLAVKTGYLFEGFAGVGRQSSFDDITYTGRASEIFINFAILFRINDSY
jgi:hypothetical protein